MKAVYAVEMIGRGAGRAERLLGNLTPWAARLHGVADDGGFVREFLRPHVDYRDANSTGTRGIWYRWVLSPGPVYEVASRSRFGRPLERTYHQVTADGEVASIAWEEALAWASALLASTS